MLCPVCKTVNLAMTDRQGIEIDYCPSCRGVWLDRGELDRLIERAEQGSAPPPVAAAPPRPERQYDKPYEKQSDRHYDSDAGRHYGHGHKKRPKSLLGELFDF